MIYEDFIEKYAPQLVGTMYEETCGMIDRSMKCRFRFNGNEFAICLKCGCARFRKTREDKAYIEGSPPGWSVSWFGGT